MYIVMYGLFSLQVIAQVDTLVPPQELETAVVKADAEVIQCASNPCTRLEAPTLKRSAATDFTQGMNRTPGVRS